MEGEMQVYGLTKDDAYRIGKREETAFQLEAMRETMARIKADDDLANEFEDQISSIELELAELTNDLRRSANSIRADERDAIMEGAMIFADVAFDQAGWVR